MAFFKLDDKAAASASATPPAASATKARPELRPVPVAQPRPSVAKSVAKARPAARPAPVQSKATASTASEEWEEF